MKGFTFDRGVHFPAKKELSGSSPIEKLEPGDKVYLSVQQHMGAPAVSLYCLTMKPESLRTCGFHTNWYSAQAQKNRQISGFRFLKKAHNTKLRINREFSG